MEITKHYHFDGKLRNKIDKHKGFFFLLLSGIERLSQKSEVRRSVEVSDHLTGLKQKSFSNLSEPYILRKENSRFYRRELNKLVYFLVRKPQSSLGEKDDDRYI